MSFNPNQIPTIPENAPFTREQCAWLNGFLIGLFGGSSGGQEASKPKTCLPILYGSQTGTAEQLAKRMAVEAGRRDFEPRLMEMNAHGAIDLKQEKRLLLVTSTWGDGDPPDNAVAFWNYLNSDQAPRLDHLEYSVLALGDRNYANFCAAGKKFDARLEQLGAKRVHPCVECDTDYEAPATEWMNAVWSKLVADTPGKYAAAPVTDAESKNLPVSPPGYSKTNRFPARLLTNRKLNGAGSVKDTRHFEISLGDSGLSYEVGDALGVMPTNCPTLTNEILTALNCDGEEAVKLPDSTETALRKALLEHFQITRATKQLLAAFAERSGDAELIKLLEPDNKVHLDKFMHGREVIHLLSAYPNVSFAPAEFVANLPKLHPRLYSIASSPKAHPGEVHLTVAVVRYDSYGRPCKGVCSTFLAERADASTPVPVYVQSSHGFRLPQNPDAPVIMIGPGTGIAPFRAFLEERRAAGAKGKNWLFSGDQRRATDFLYRDELEAALRDGHLKRLDTAFSRDQAEKIYVQHRMIEQAQQLWSWLEEGAHVYVCGDAKCMAKDVDAALHQVIQTAGNRPVEAAAAYVKKLKDEKRYQRDVY
jgi:sulfite reductase (NADPH) flavoprotein alpha-component